MHLFYVLIAVALLIAFFGFFCSGKTARQSGGFLQANPKIAKALST